VTCASCQYAAKFHSYQQRRVLTVHGAVTVRRAYYYCGRCQQSFLPYDEVLGLVDEISPGLMPLVCLAGSLLPFADAAEDVLQRFAGVRVSTSTVLRSTEGEGERLRAQQKQGRMVEPLQPELAWTAPREEGQPVAYVGLARIIHTHRPAKLTNESNALLCRCLRIETAEESLEQSATSGMSG